MVIYLILLLPAVLSNLPESSPGRFKRFLFGLASDGVYMCPVCYQTGGSLLHCPSTLAVMHDMTVVHFCCTFLGVASTGRYPAFCPVKPGLSSPAVFRHLQPRSFVLLILKLKERRKNFATPLNIHYSFNFRKKIFFRKNIFFARIFFPPKFSLLLYIKTASADKFTQNGILVNPIARHRKEIVQEFQQTLCL